MDEEKVTGFVIGAFTGLLAFFVVLWMAFMAIVGVGTSANCLTAVTDPTVKYDSTDASVSDARQYFGQFSEESRKTRLENARQIIMVGLERNEPVWKIETAVGTAIQETNLTNYGHLGERNDHDSCGIFQQQWTQGWGESCTQLTDIVFASTQFYNALDKIPDERAQSLSMMERAILVQNPSRSAYERRWAWDDVAVQTVAIFVQNDPRSSSCYGGVNAEGWRLPLDEGYSFTSPYGLRTDPDPRVTERKMHYGVDLAVGVDTPIYATHDGTVSFAGWNGTEKTGYGRQIRINHPGGVETSYSHMNQFVPGLVEGTPVVAGQIIGYVGTSGRSYGYHLHFEVKVNGTHEDPAAFMRSVNLEF